MDLEEGGAASWHEPGSLNDCVEPRSLLLLTSQHPSNLEWDVLPVIHKLLYLATNDFLTYCSVTTVQCTVLYITVHVLYCNNGLPCPLCVCAHTCMHTHTHSLSHDRLCEPMDCSPPSSSVYGILQARILERVAISSSRGSSQRRDHTCISCISRGILYL